MTRLRILSEEEIDKFYKIPKLSDTDRNDVFKLDECDNNYLATLSSMETRINYILQLGYFRVSQYFFTFKFYEVYEDVRFIMDTYLPNDTLSVKKKKMSNRQYYANRQFILQKYKMNLYSQTVEDRLYMYLKSLVKQCSVPKYLFDSIVSYCYQRQIIRPSYSGIAKEV